MAPGWVSDTGFIERDTSVRRTESRQSQRGTAIYEAVIATPLFLLLIFAAIQFMVLAWRNLAVQFVATLVLRSVVTGQCGGTAENPTYCKAEDPTRQQQILNRAMLRARELGTGYGLGDVTSDTNFKVCIRPVNSPLTTCTASTAIPDQMTAGQLWEVWIAHDSPIVAGVLNLVLGGGAVGYGAIATNGSAVDPRFGLEGRAIGRLEIVNQ